MALARALSGTARKVVVGVGAGACTGLLAAALALARPDLAESLEFASYDPRVAAVARDERASREIVLVDIADEDLQLAEDHLSLSWPWPRELHGYLVDFAARGGAKAVILDFVYQDRGASASDLDAFALALRKSGRSVLGVAMPGRVESGAGGALAGTWGASLGRWPDAERARDAALQIQSWNVRTYLVARGAETELLFGGRQSAEDVQRSYERLLGAGLLEKLMPEGRSPPASVAGRELTEQERAAELSAVQVVRSRDLLSLAAPPGVRFPAREMLPPVSMLAASAARLGNVVQSTDPDGVLRRHLPLVEHGSGRFMPSLALSAFLVGHPEVTPRLEGADLVLGERRLRLDERGSFPIRFPAGEYRHVSAWSILRAQAQLEAGETPTLSPEVFRDKYVVVSAAARALRDLRTTPVRENHPGAEINAAALDNLLSGRAIRRLGAGWDAAFALALAALTALAVLLVWSLLKSPSLAVIAALGILAASGFGVWSLGLWLLRAHGLWLALSVPLGGAGLSVVASLLATNFLERGERRFVEKALGQYTSKVLVRQLLARPERLSLEWGETREISVYFSDIAGFTEFSEKLPPERLVKLLNDYLTNMTDLVLEHGGVVDKYIGDAIMAFWGAPLPEPEHARRAVRAAIAMRRRCEELRPKWQAEFGTVVVARAGINSGPAVSGNMGSRHKFNYTVMGDTVNLASRLEGANKPYGTVLMVSETTFAQVRDLVEARELDLLAVKGKQKPVRVYEVLDEKGRVPPLLQEAVAHFGRGLGHYRNQAFAEAIAAFEQALRVRADDGPSRAYVDRCKHLLDHPPGAGWDGVWRMKEK
ncbi:MAG TPA: adenylate/guanylate cyclase domain-containing protein [Myxococcales bacterium]